MKRKTLDRWLIGLGMEQAEEPIFKHLPEIALEEEVYCNNDPCEDQATHFYVTDDLVHFYLCDTCKDAFELGQVNPDKDIYPIGEEP